MNRSHRVVAFVIVAALAVAASAHAQGPALVPAAPGTVVQSQTADLTPSAPGGPWRAVASKKVVGSGNGQTFYQWYLSVYAPRQSTFRLRYQSPANGGPLERVAQASGAKMWFPVQQLHIVGAAPLMGGGAAQLVVQSHEMAADCGSAAVTVLKAGSSDNVFRAVSVVNPCDLIAKIGADHVSIELTGPYYDANAPMCCPTKNHATAVLRYNGVRWVETPSYFKTK